MPKYSGAYVPDAGGDDSGEPESSPPSARTYSGAFGVWREEREDNKARLAAWMNGKEPRQWWEIYSETTKFFCMEFPGTVHYFVVAYEDLPEIGKLYVWCFGCKNGICGACKWTRAAYVAEIKREIIKGYANEDDLPF